MRKPTQLALPFSSISLRWVDETANCRRFYAVEIQRDSFGQTLLGIGAGSALMGAPGSIYWANQTLRFISEHRRNFREPVLWKATRRWGCDCG